MWHHTEEDFNQEFGYDDDASYEHEHYNGMHHEPAEADDDASYEHEHYNGLHHEPAEADDEEKKKEDDDSKKKVTRARWCGDRTYASKLFANRETCTDVGPLVGS